MAHPHLTAALCSVLTLGLAAGCETHPRQGDVRIHQRDADIRIVFTDRDRAAIRDYFSTSRHRLPPGLAKKGKVPPGHAMKLYRGHPVPPGYSWSSLPRDLEGRLSRLPGDYVRIQVGADIGIMNLRTRVVVDLLEFIDD